MNATPAAVADRTARSGSFEITSTSEGRLEVQGPLVFGTACQAREEGLRALQDTSAREIEIDCQGITASDSAGLTVLLDWLGAAKQQGRSLRFTNLPKELLAIAHISEVAELLQKGV